MFTVKELIHLYVLAKMWVWVETGLLYDVCMVRGRRDSPCGKGGRCWAPISRAVSWVKLRTVTTTQCPQKDGRRPSRAGIASTSATLAAAELALEPVLL